VGDAEHKSMHLGKLKGRGRPDCPQVRDALWDIDQSPVLQSKNTSTRKLLTKAVQPCTSVKWTDTLLSSEKKFTSTVNTEPIQVEFFFFYRGLEVCVCIKIYIFLQVYHNGTLRTFMIPRVNGENV